MSLYLPVSSLARTAPPDESAQPRVPTRPTTILVVDDESSVRLVSRKILEKSGHRVFEAEGAVEAMTIADATLSEVEVAVIDVSMPDGSGVDVAIALLGRAPQLRLVMMSAYDRDDALLGAPVECGTFLAKPFRAEDLLERVADAMAVD